jgi:hypothetical protein
MASHTFEQWVDGIFDHEVADPAWFWAEGADHCVEDDETNVEYLTRLFTHCDRVLARFDNARLDQGLNFVAFPSCSDHSLSITYGNASWPKRRACIRSIYDLYAKCFAVRCSGCLSHSEACENPLNGICYMWWDLLGGRCGRNDAASDIEGLEYLGVMERSLTLSHEACLEGALHGLGHWHRYYPERVKSTIDAFLQSRSDLRPELVLYARRARKGAVQ